MITQKPINGVSIKPWMSNATPCLASSGRGRLSILRVMYLNIEVIYVSGLTYTRGMRNFGISVVGIYAPERNVNGMIIMVLTI